MINNGYNGWVFIDKPIGASSNYILQKVRKIFSNIKAGYVGTLDPLASGFLPIALGSATKTIKFIEGSYKEYIFEVKWGESSTTGDSEGELKEKTKIIPNENEIRETIDNFIGVYHQRPPIFSSKKINGLRAYRLAKKKISFELKKERKKIYDLKIINLVSNAKASFFVKCSSGTYVRSLAEDIAKSLKTYGVITSLRRVGFGNFDKKLISLDYLLSLVHIEDLLGVVKPLNLVFNEFNQICLDENEVNHILNGRPVKLKNGLVNDNNLYKGYTFAKFKDVVIAVGYLKDKSFYPKNLLNNFLSERNQNNVK